MKDEVDMWMEKLEKVKKGESDLSKDEDLSIALMNLISLEEHFYFTAMKTDNENYLKMLNNVRSLRKKLLKKIVTSPEGEEWCISKHLLAASMRLVEVGTKELAENNKKDARMLFRNAFDLYSLFFAINMKMVDKEKIISDTDHDNKFFRKFSEAVKKLVDCCKE